MLYLINYQYVKLYAPEFNRTAVQLNLYNVYSQYEELRSTKNGNIYCYNFIGNNRNDGARD